MALSTDSSAFNNLQNRPSPSPRPSNPHYLAWTPAHEERLLIVQKELAKAQAEWSEEQDIWLDEVSNRLAPPTGVSGLPQSRLAFTAGECLNVCLC